MKRIVSLFTVTALITVFIFASGSALADGATGVAVQPLAPKPGDIIKVKGEVLGANRTVEVRIIGTNVNIDLGEVQTNAEGDFTAEFRVPENLTAGNYQVQAKGEQTATTTITVVTAGAAQPDPMSQPAPELRQRSLGESIGLIALFGVLAAAGIVFARTARHAPVAG